MRSPRAVLPSTVSVFVALSLLVFSAPSVLAQASKDAQAVAVLNSCLNAAGGIAAITAIQDSTASGTITYYWADQAVQGAVTLRSKGLQEVRLDAALSSGTRSWAVNALGGSILEPDGMRSLIPYANIVGLNALPLRVARASNALLDPSVSILYMGMVTVNGISAHQIRLQPVFTAGDDPGGIRARLNTSDLFIDRNSSLIIKTQDSVYPTGDVQQPHVHELFFADYRSISGLLMPFAISEKVSGQQTWVLQLDSITFNVGLSDSDFQL